MRSFWKNAGIMSFAEIFLKLKAFIMMPFIAHHFGTMDYGIWSQVMVVAALLSPLIFLGTDTALVRFLPGQELEDQKRDFSGWLLFGLFCSLALLSLVWLFSEELSFIVFGKYQIYTPYIKLAGLNIVVTALSLGIRNWFRIQSNAKALVFFTISQNIIQMGIMIWILVANRTIYELIVFSILMDFLFLFLFLFYFLYHRILVRPSFKHIASYLKFGIVVIPGAYAIWGTTNLDRIFMAHYNSISDIGVYAIAFTFGYTLIQTIVNPIWSLYFAKAAELYNQSKIKDLEELFNDSIKLILWLMIPSIFGLFLVGEYLMNILTTSEFSKGYIVIPIVLSSYLLIMLSGYFESILTLRGKPQYPTYFVIIAFFVNLIMNIILIPEYSYYGAAIATLIAFGVQITLSYITFKKEKIFSLNFNPIYKIFSSSIFMFCVCYILNLLIHFYSDILLIFTLTIFGTIVYIIITHILKIYNLNIILNSLKGEINYE